MNTLGVGVPEASAGLPVFNGDATIADALRGPLTKSTSRTFEVAVAVAGNDSTDRTASIVEWARQDGSMASAMPIQPWAR
jgi:hypothetical protein